MEVININDKSKLFSDHWSPHIIAELNGQQVKIAKVKGEFVWHDHRDEDEMFFVVEGKLNIAFKDHTIVLQAGEMLVVPKGTLHKPFAEEETLIMLFEPAATKHTGEVSSELTKTKEIRI